MLYRAASKELVIAPGTINIISLQTTIKNLSEAAEKTESTLVLLPLNCIASERQLLHGTEQAIEAFEGGRAFSRNLELEVLMRVLGEKKIDKALKAAGFGEGRQEVVLLSIAASKQRALKGVKEFSKTGEFKQKDSLMKGSTGERFKALSEKFGVSEKELGLFNCPKEKALELFLLERIAMVSVK